MVMSEIERYEQVKEQKEKCIHLYSLRVLFPDSNV